MTCVEFNRRMDGIEAIFSEVLLNKKSFAPIFYREIMALKNDVNGEGVIVVGVQEDTRAGEG